MQQVISRRRLGWCLAAALAVVGIVPAAAQTFPDHTIRIIVPSPPGGGYDLIGRLLSEKLYPELGQPLVVENRTGAGTLVGTQAAASAAPDGYTLLVGGLANMAFNAGLYKEPRYDAVRDFTAIGLVGSFSYALVGRRDLPQHTLKEIIGYAHANPGKLSIASAGTGTGQHIASLMLRQLTKSNLVEVPYKGAQPAYTDLLGGRVDLFFDNTTTAQPLADAGRIQVYATSGSKRDTLMPKVPTGPEAGVDGLVLDGWIGLFAPSKTPAPAVAKLRTALAKVMQSPETRKRLESGGWRIIDMSPAQTEAFVKAEAVKWPLFLRQAGIKPE
ncbi:MAG TPA: tripartite tricarboxylate transporter substrate binding protein [Burkholderiales bacterium]